MFGLHEKREIFRQLWTIDLGIDGNVSSRAIDYKWNDDDPIVRSPRMSLESLEPPTTTFRPLLHDRSPFLSTAVVVHLLACSEPAGSARVSIGGLEDLHQAWAVTFLAREIGEWKETRLEREREWAWVRVRENNEKKGQRKVTGGTSTPCRDLQEK